MKKNFIINLILIAVILFNLFRSYKLFDFSKLTRPFDFKKYENRYNKSQWVVPNSRQSVGDDLVYAYAGARYIKGDNPTMINSEHPPFAKNLIGISAVYFGNEYYFGIMSGLFMAVSFFFLAKTVLKNTLTSVLITVAVGLEPLLVANYFSTLLDLVVLGFLNWYFYFLIKYRLTKKTFFVYSSGAALGFIVSSKFFGIAAPIVLSTVLYFSVCRDFKGLINYFLSFFLTAVIYISNYFQFFLHGKSLIDFLKLQKYMYVFHTSGRQSSTGLNWSLPSLLFTGRFFTDIKHTAPEEHFSLLWPISFVFTLFNLPRKILSPITFWIVIYLLTQLFSLTNSRYLILVLPYFFLMAVDIMKIENI